MKKLIVLALILSTSPAFSLCLINQQTAVTATTTSALAIAANSRRCALLVINDGDQTVYLKSGSAHSGTEGVPIIALGNWEPYRLFGDALYVKAASGSQSVRVIEWIEK